MKSNVHEALDPDNIGSKKLEQCVLLIAEIMSDQDRYIYFKNLLAELRSQIDSPG
jgi:hypothetical protein